MDETELQDLLKETAEKAFVRSASVIADFARSIAHSQDLSGVSGKDVLLLFARTIEGSNVTLLRNILDAEKLDADR